MTNTRDPRRRSEHRTAIYQLQRCCPLNSLHRSGLGGIWNILRIGSVWNDGGKCPTYATLVDVKCAGALQTSGRALGRDASERPLRLALRPQCGVCGGWCTAAQVKQNCCGTGGVRSKLNSTYSTTEKDIPCIDFPYGVIFLFTCAHHAVLSRHRCCRPRCSRRKRGRRDAHRAFRQPVSNDGSPLSQGTKPETYF